MLLCYFLPIITIEWEDGEDCWYEWECTQTCTCGTEYVHECYYHHGRECCDVSCDDGCSSENCEGVEVCNESSEETHSFTIAPIQAMGRLEWHHRKTFQHSAFSPGVCYGMALGLGTKLYMLVANPMPTCCASKQGWKCGAIQQIIGVILYFLAFVMIMAGHGQAHAAVDDCDPDDCTQQDKDNMKNAFDAVFGALYPLMIVPLLFAILNGGLLCKAKDDWPDERQVAAQAPAIAQVPVAQVYLSAGRGEAERGGGMSRDL